MGHVASAPIQLHQYRRFGPSGPVYQIMSHGHTDEMGEQWLRVQLVGSGEVTDYKVAHAADDPVEF